MSKSSCGSGNTLTVLGAAGRSFARDSAENDGRAHVPAETAGALELAHLAARGNRAATQELLSDVLPTLFRVVAHVLGAQHPDLDDAVQQSMIAFVRALPAFRAECHPAGYAARIARRMALRVRRSAERDLVRRDTLTRLAPGVEGALAASEDTLGARGRELVRELIEDLPEEQAGALTLRIVLGYSLDEVSLASRAPVNTVRSRLRLAKDALRQRIESFPCLAELERESC